mgnify:CR=1 FL=1
MAQSSSPIKDLKKPMNAARVKINAILPKNTNLSAVQSQ